VEISGELGNALLILQYAVRRHHGWRKDTEGDEEAGGRRWLVRVFFEAIGKGHYGSAGQCNCYSKSHRLHPCL
jgi:hypothetical protein